MLNKKILFTLLIFLVSLITVLSFSSATVQTNPRNNSFGSILDNFWYSINPFGPSTPVDPNEDADIYGWYNGTFFGLASWERDVCLADLSQDVRSLRDEVQTNDQRSFYITTITASGTKIKLLNSTMYEVGWYLMPIDADVEYRIYIMGTSKQYLAGRDNQFIPVKKNVGVSGYDVKYLGLNFDNIKIEYQYVNDSGSIKTYSAKLVETNIDGTPVLTRP